MINICVPHRLELKHILKLNKMFDKEEQPLIDLDTTTIRCKRRDYDSQIIVLLQSSLSHRDKLIFVAKSDKDIIGYVLGHIDKSINPFFTMKNLGCVDSIFVHPDHRNNKIGDLLMEALEKEFKKLNCEVIYLKMLSDNPAQSFYDRKAYKKCIVEYRKSL